MAVDLETYQRYLLAEKKAKDLGLSLVEVLDRAQLLLTADRRHNLSVQAVEDVCRRLDRQSPNKLMAYFNGGRTEGTSAEMFEATKKWLEIVVQNLAKKTLEDL